MDFPVGETTVRLEFVRNLRARRYILRIRRSGGVRVTVPRGGSLDYALKFARKNVPWIVKELKRRCESQQAEVCTDGAEILFRGERCPLTSQVNGELRLVRFANEVLAVPAQTSDYRQSIEQYLWFLAEKELPPRTLQLAAQHQLTVGRVVVRNQRSRWGSCSPRRTISLNWRLIHAPESVRNYLILHELMHLREMNHSARFWQWVRFACPGYQDAEAWLDRHAYLLR